MHAEPLPPSSRQPTAPSNPSSDLEQTSHAGNCSSACLLLAEHCSCMHRNQLVSDKARAQLSCSLNMVEPASLHCRRCRRRDAL